MRILPLIAVVFFGIFSYGQETKEHQNDSTSVEQLEEVVVTGQHNPQSVKKSVFEVKVIKRQEIEQRATNNLADLLNQTLNINITPNTATGKSGVSLFGLDSQYFKILIDNVPVINEEGLGNNVDLTLINLDDIEQIEIVEGAMGVQYGANAVSGVINIITKKSTEGKTSIHVYTQEETVGSEYELFDQGRHIQSVKIGHNFTDKIYGNVAYTRNDFAGYWNDRQGEIYDVNDGLRGHEWLPKEQHNAKLLLQYKTEGFNIFYKADYLNERINDYSATVDDNYNSATDTSDPTAIDRLFTNNRYVHHLNSNGRLFKQVNYNISVSYQEQTKDLETYTYRIREDQKLQSEEQEYLSRSAFFSRGTFSNLILTNTFSLQAGYELSNEKGSGSPFALFLAPGEELVSNRLENYDAFASTEIQINDRFSVRPGARVSFTNMFDTQYTVSLSSRYLLKNNFELRAVIGSANRTPNFEELYTRLVDINHNVQGNPDLEPERGISAFVHLKKGYVIGDALFVKNKISASYIDLKDRIELTIVNPNPLEQKYNNINSYKSFGFFTENSFKYHDWKAQLGASFLGVSKVLDNTVNSNDDFLFNFQLNTNVTYNVSKWNTAFALYYKYVGKEQQFVERTNDAGNSEFQRGTTDAFSWLDFTVKTNFLQNSLVATVGARNILDVDTVNTTAFSGGAHSAAPQGINMAYGRSYFLKLAYNLNF